MTVAPPAAPRVPSARWGLLALAAWLLFVAAIAAAIRQPLGFPDGHLTEADRVLAPVLTAAATVDGFAGVAGVALAGFGPERARRVAFVAGVALFLVHIVGAVVLHFRLSGLEHGGGG